MLSSSRRASLRNSSSFAADAGLFVPGMVFVSIKLIKGTTYQTPRGAATWDGQKFMPA
jgi:hypothetical protein